MPTEPGLPPDQVDWDALARYFAGESSAEEAEATSRWLAEHPEEAEAFAAIDSVTARLDALPAESAETEPDVDAAWQRVAAQLDEAPAPTKMYTFEPRRRAPLWRSPALRAAAAVALVAGGVAVWKSGSSNIIVDTHMIPAVYRTAAGERDSVVLEDGTKVVLGPGSELLIDDVYGNARRDVTLNGEALFDVRHDDARPFVVHAGDLLVHDLGTTFTVRTTNGTSGATTVAVTVGSVRMARTVTATDSGVVLHAGDRGTAVPGAVFTIERGAALDDQLAFTRGELVFRDTPLPEVASSLRRWYGVEVRMADSALVGRTLTASFSGEPLADVLRVIGLALDAPVVQQDSTVVIGRRDPPRNPSR